MRLRSSESTILGSVIASGLSRWRDIRLCIIMIALVFATSAAKGQVLYVSSGQRVILEVSPAGVVTTFATLPTNSFPYGLAFDGTGNLYSCDNGTGTISKIAPDGSVSSFATLPVNSFPAGLAIDRAGNIYSADAGTNQISKITPGGVVSLFASLPGSEPSGLAFDSTGNLYASGLVSHDISKISADGIVSLFSTLPANTGPTGLAFDKNGNLFVSEDANGMDSLIDKIDPFGNISRFATTSSGQSDLAFDANGDLYVATIGEINMVSQDGLTVTPFATTPESTFFTFSPVPEPSSIVLLVVAVAFAVLRRRRFGSSRKAPATV